MSKSNSSRLRLDPRDVFIGGELLCISVGVGLYQLALGLIVFGVAITAIGLWALGIGGKV